MLARDWRKAARFYARVGITEGIFYHGVPTEGDRQAEPEDLSLEQTRV